MPPYRPAGMLALPDFRGFTRTLIVWNVGIYFVFLLLGLAAPQVQAMLLGLFMLAPSAVLHGFVWQLVTYSFINLGLLNILLSMLALWFLGSFLEGSHGSRWMGELFFTGVLGASLATTGLAVATGTLQATYGLSGAFGGTFALLIAFGTLYGDLQFTLFPLPIAIKARYLVAIYVLISLAQLFGGNRIYAFGQLGGALLGYLYIRFAPRRGGITTAGSKRYFNLRNEYYRWKRRNAAKKFEVYMRKQNRDVRFDSEGRYIDPDTGRPSNPPRDPNDRSWMN